MVMVCEFIDGSYPCGYKEGKKLPDCELCHKIRKASMGEVVEFLKEQEQDEGSDTLHYFVISRDNWQAYLKKHGL